MSCEGQRDPRRAADERLRIVSWNIRAGGGRRVEDIAGQLARWDADVVALQEFRATPPSRWLAATLDERGLRFQRTTATSRSGSANRLLVASRWPLRRVGVRAAPEEAGRWLLARIAAPEPFAVGAMHIPNYATGRKGSYHDAALEVARRWRGGPALLIGDTNTGRPDVDEESPVFGRDAARFMDGMERAGWRDAFRQLHGDRREYTWYSPNGRNGFRLDEAFVNRRLLPSLVEARHEWGAPAGATNPRREALSDHAALIVDLSLGDRRPSRRLRRPAPPPGTCGEPAPPPEGSGRARKRSR
jgi:exonuclease III